MPDQNLLRSPSDIPSGMFSSPQILKCLKAGLLLEGWEPRFLQSATYSMRLGMFSCWYVDGLRTNWPLGEHDDRNRDIHRILVFKPNSLTYVTTLESFLLPCDVIARFNLRTRWVRKGLLLGTAPIVEPQFKGRLLIPIHNFSSDPVQIEFGDPLVEVEFTKTLPVDSEYVPNPDPVGEIGKYLDLTGVVESSVYSALARNEELYKNIASKTKMFSIAGAITLFLLICSVVTLLLNIFNLAENTRKTAAQAQSVVEAVADRSRADFIKLEDRIRELEFELGKLRQESAKPGQ